jgi:hypothetical protein
MDTNLTKAVAIAVVVVAFCSRTRSCHYYAVPSAELKLQPS